MTFAMMVVLSMFCDFRAIVPFDPAFAAAVWNLWVVFMSGDVHASELMSLDQIISSEALEPIVYGKHEKSQETIVL